MQHGHPGIWQGSKFLVRPNLSNSKRCESEPFRLGLKDYSHWNRGSYLCDIPPPPLEKGGCPFPQAANSKWAVGSPFPPANSNPPPRGAGGFFSRGKPVSFAGTALRCSPASSVFERGARSLKAKGRRLQRLFFFIGGGFRCFFFHPGAWERTRAEKVATSPDWFGLKSPKGQPVVSAMRKASTS